MSETLKNTEQIAEGHSTGWESLSEVPFAGDNGAEKPTANLDPVRAQYLETRNMRDLNEATLKNGYFDDKAEAVGSGYAESDAGKVVKEISEKLSAGGKLDAQDIISLADPSGLFDTLQQSGDFLNSLGIAEGSDFDVRMPSEYIHQDGRRTPTPLEISFRNQDGQVTRIDIDNGLRYDAESNSMVRTGKEQITSYTAGEDNIVSNPAPQRNNIGANASNFKFFSSDSLQNGE